MTSSELSKLLIPTPFAKNGTITPIEAASEDMPNFLTGFPENFSAPHSGDGRYVARAMMNAVGHMATANEYFRQAGGIYQFDAEWARVNGGYPRGAVLDFLNGNKLYKVLSLVDNNLVDFTGKEPTAAQASAGITAGSVDGVNWLYCNVDQEVKYNEICDVPNFTWQGGLSSETTTLFNGETFPIAYFKPSRNGIISTTGTIDFTATMNNDGEGIQHWSGGFAIVVCPKVDGEFKNPWEVKGTMIYQRGHTITYSTTGISYNVEDLKTMNVYANQEYTIYILNFGGNVANSTMKIVVI